MLERLWKCLPLLSSRTPHNHIMYNYFIVSDYIRKTIAADNQPQIINIKAIRNKSPVLWHFTLLGNPNCWRWIHLGFCIFFLPIFSCHYKKKNAGCRIPLVLFLPSFVASLHIPNVFPRFFLNFFRCFCPLGYITTTKVTIQSRLPAYFQFRLFLLSWLLLLLYAKIFLILFHCACGC